MNNRIVAKLLLLVFAVNVKVAFCDYTYSCWVNGWRKNVNDRSDDIFAVETSHYGFTLDVADFRKAGLGRLNNPAGYEQALAHNAGKLKKLPPAELLIELEIDGTRYRATTCKAGREKGVKHLSHVRLWESGRYVQHYDFPGLDFRNSGNEKLICDATLDLVAWPETLTFNLNVSASFNCNKAVLRLGLKSQEDSWIGESKVQGPWKSDQENSVSMTCFLSVVDKIPSADITVSAENGQAIPVHFDNNKNCYVAPVKRLKRSWKTGYTDIRDYDDFKIKVSGSDSKAAIPFLLDMRAPANITGICPILCNKDGCPAGIPVQLSKNWHYKPMGSYLMAYVLLPAGKPTVYIMRLVYGFYGTLPSVSHAQLCLVGYGGNGRWDQLAIGCWGETICFDMDMSLVDVAITDIRMLMTRKGVNGKKWIWTEAGWGGDWLNIQDDSQKKLFRTELKTAYLSQGPCLTNVKYMGYYGANREVKFSSRVQIPRTDDFSRTFQTFNYTFTRDVSARKIWLFKLGRTYNYHTPRIACGNADGLLVEKDAPDTLKKGQLVMDHVTLTGPAPYWVVLPGAVYTLNNRPDGYRALIIRKHKIVAGGKTYTNPVISAPVYKTNPTNLDIELVPPAGLRQYHKGDRIALDVELITLPRRVDDYYGPNKAFRKHLSETPCSWKTTYREAKGNDLDIKVSGGRKRCSYPVVIQVEEPEVTVTIKGGIGTVPIRFEGLQPHAVYRLYRSINGKRIKFDQSVHGNDFWQTDYETASDTCKMSFNLPLDGLVESQWILTCR